MRCCTGGDPNAPLTSADRRILADLADPNPATRHTRSSMAEWRERSAHLLARGLIEHGDAKRGQAHLVTVAGAEALNASPTWDPAGGRPILGLTPPATTADALREKVAAMSDEDLMRLWEKLKAL